MADDPTKDDSSEPVRRPFEDLEDVPVLPDVEETVLDQEAPKAAAPKPAPPPAPARPPAAAAAKPAAAPAPAPPVASARPPTAGTAKPAPAAPQARTPTAATPGVPKPAAPAAPPRTPTAAVPKPAPAAPARPPTAAAPRPAAPPVAAPRAAAPPPPPERKRVPSGDEIQAAIDAVGEDVPTIPDEEPEPAPRPLRELRRPSRVGREVASPIPEPGEWTDEDTYVFRSAGLVMQRGPIPILFVLTLLVVLAWAGLYGHFYWSGDRPIPELAEVEALFGGKK